MTTLLGRVPDQLSIGERREFAGKWIAIELYSPKTLPLRRIEAAGETVAACVRQLRDKQMTPTHFEYQQIHPAY